MGLVMNKTALNHTSCAIGSNAEVLSEIHHPAKNIAIYERSITHLEETVSSLVNNEIKYDSTGTLDEIQEDLAQYLAGYTDDSQHIIADIIELLKLFGNVVNTTVFTVFLATINSDMCRKFHTDVNQIRMLCTYFGSGTLWLPDSAIEIKLDDETKRKKISINEELAEEVATGNVVLLKGSLYPNATPVYHRSPSIKENNYRRLLLRVDIGK